MSRRTYPRHVHQRGGVFRVVRDADEDAQAQADGWVDHPLLEWGHSHAYREWDGVPLERAEGDDELPVVEKPPRKKPGPKPKLPVEPTV